MIVAYLLVLAGIACVTWGAEADLVFVSFVGGGLLVVAVRWAYETGKGER